MAAIFCPVVGLAALVVDLATRAASNVKAGIIRLISLDQGAAAPVPQGVPPGVGGGAGGGGAILMFVVSPAAVVRHPFGQQVDPCYAFLNAVGPVDPLNPVKVQGLSQIEDAVQNMLTVSEPLFDTLFPWLAHEL